MKFKVRFKIRILLLISLFFCMDVSSIAQYKNTVQKNKVTTSFASRGSRSVLKTYNGLKSDAGVGNAVDLGLSVLWADRNVGALSPKDYGGLFGWGDVTGASKRSRDLKDYPDVEHISGTQYDAAHVYWGDGWRMPTKKEVIELVSRCLISAVSDGNGGIVLKLVARNGKSILLPLAGYLNPYGSYDGYRMQGNFWTGDINYDQTIWNNGILSPRAKNFWDGDEVKCSFLMFDWQCSLSGLGKKMVYVSDKEKRFGFSIRPVKDKKNVNGGDVSSVKGISSKKTNENSVKAGGIERVLSSKPQLGIDATSTNIRLGKNTGVRRKESKKKYMLDSNSHQKVEVLKESKKISKYGVVLPTPKPQRKDSVTIHPTISDTHAVDLGLSVKWADRNIGAKDITDIGRLCGWGDPWGVKISTDKREYWNEDIPANISGTEKDVAHRILKGKWRMPTLGEMKELLEKCIWVWGAKDGKTGYTITGPNGNKIFLPTTGYRYWRNSCDTNVVGNYWTATQKGNGKIWSLMFASRFYEIDYESCTFGYGVRAVME